MYKTVRLLITTMITLMVIFFFIGLGSGVSPITISPNYSNGTRIVTIEKVSRKGNFFKTNEGTGILSGHTTDANNDIVRAIFKFSVVDSIFDSLQVHTGKRVKLHYNEALVRSFKEGSSTYMVYNYTVVE